MMSNLKILRKMSGISGDNKKGRTASVGECRSRTCWFVGYGAMVPQWRDLSVVKSGCSRSVTTR